MKRKTTITPAQIDRLASRTAQLDELATTETYQDIQSIIWYQINRFTMMFKYLEITKDDLLSLANEVFMDVYHSFDITRGCKFHKYLSFKIWYGFLQEYVQKDIRQRKRAMGKVRTVDFMEIDLPSQYGTYTSSRHSMYSLAFFNLKEFMEELTTDAHMITKLIIDSPADLRLAMRLDSPNPNGRSCRTSLRQYLLGLGWDACRIAESFKEISKALR